MINREKGAGSRVLLDENLKRLGTLRQQIRGYGNENQSHLTVASAVGRGDADVAVGNEKVARQVENVDFIPLKKERYDLVVKKELSKPRRSRQCSRFSARNDFGTSSSRSAATTSAISAKLWPKPDHDWAEPRVTTLK